MRKRQVKKFAKRAKRNRTPYRQARNGGNKKFRRRLKAFNRVHRAYDRWQAKRLDDLKILLEQIDSYEPRNEEERLGIAEHRAKVAGAIARREAKLQRDLELKKELEAAQRELKRVGQLLEVAVNSSGGWGMVKGI